MALKLNVSSRWIVSIFDDAIDVEHEETNVRRYIDEGYPANYEDYLVFKDGEEPTTFEIESLSLNDRERINNRMRLTMNEEGTSMKADNGPRYREAFECGVINWSDNLGVKFNRLHNKVDPKLLSQIGRAQPKSLFEIGQVILEQSHLDSEAKN